MNELKENLKSQAQTLTTILVKLLVESELSLSVDRKGNMYFRDQYENEVMVTAEELYRLYSIQEKLKEEK